jgi:hypothetical protein
LPRKQLLKINIPLKAHQAGINCPSAFAACRIAPNLGHILRVKSDTSVRSFGPKAVPIRTNLDEFILVLPVTPIASFAVPVAVMVMMPIFIIPVVITMVLVRGAVSEVSIAEPRTTRARSSFFIRKCDSNLTGSPQTGLAVFLLKLAQPLLPRWSGLKDVSTADLRIVTIQILPSLVRTPKLLGLHFGLPELHIGTVVFDHRKHTGVEVVE